MNYKNSRILVTGGSGFLGKCLLNKLKEKKYNNIFSFKKKDYNLSSQNDTKELFELVKPDIVINAAALVGGINFSRKFPGQVFLENMKIQINTLDFSRLYKVRKLVNIGSACIYSDQNKPPFKEEDFDNKKMHPSVFYYGFSKLTQIYGSAALQSEFGLKTINLQPANLYGPTDKFNAENSHVISAMIKKFSIASKKKLQTVSFYGTGNTIREFIHVEDCAEGIIKALENYNCMEPMNIGTGQGIKIKELAKIIAGLVGYEGKIFWDKSIEDGAKVKVLDNSKMAKNLKWLPQINLNDGLKDLVMNLKKRNFFDG
jgi:GDP-L-fucose synthase